MPQEVAAPVDKAVPFVELRGLTKRYKSGAGVEGLSFAIGPGEIYCLVGGTRSGKTTVVNVLLGRESPTAGQASINGRVITAAHPEYRRGVTFVSGDCTLCPAMTTMQNVKLFVTVGSPQIRWRESAGREALRIMGVADRLFDARLRSLGPETVIQVWLAIAWLRATCVLILDEPTIRLDPHSIARLQRQLGRFRETGCALLVATSDLFFASQLADRLGILTRGRKTAERTRAEVLSSSLTELYIDYLGQAPDRSSLDHPLPPARMPL